jgi:hypothetical protein
MDHIMKATVVPTTNSSALILTDDEGNHLADVHIIVPHTKDNYETIAAVVAGEMQARINADMIGTAFGRAIFYGRFEGSYSGEQEHYTKLFINALKRAFGVDYTSR